jgi:polysaccharide pyruvyl transferase WcaK-like protein
MNRRTFISASAAAIAGASLPRKLFADAKKAKRILLRSSWQTVNIGDIGHTPGVLHLLEENLPDAEIRLWPGSVKDGVEEMLRRRFPKLQIVTGDEVKKAFDECDFLLHGSGPSLVAGADVAKWRKQTGKPYGIFGITFSATAAETIETLSGAKFVYFRDSVSLQFAKEHGVKSPVMDFGPDGAFSVDLRNDEAAEKFLKASNLEDGKFLCVIPRYRNTPYWKIKPGIGIDERKHARNEAMKEHDNAPLRDAIAKVVSETAMKILLCPEDASQMAIGKEMIYDKLPDAVKSRVVWRENYWLTDEALSTYVRSAGLFGLEMHSPIMCIGNGIPAIVCRFAEQTSKGIMWRDIGLGDWLFDFDNEDEIAKLAPAALAMAKDPAAAKAKAEKARAFVRQRQHQMIETLRTNLPA